MLSYDTNDGRKRRNKGRELKGEMGAEGDQKTQWARTGRDTKKRGEDQKEEKKEEKKQIYGDRDERLCGRV